MKQMYCNCITPLLPIIWVKLTTTSRIIAFFVCLFLQQLLNSFKVSAQIFKQITKKQKQTNICQYFCCVWFCPVWAAANRLCRQLHQIFPALRLHLCRCKWNWPDLCFSCGTRKRKRKNFLDCSVPWIVSRFLRLEYSSRQNKNLKKNL